MILAFLFYLSLNHSLRRCYTKSFYCVVFLKIHIIFYCNSTFLAVTNLFYLVFLPKQGSNFIFTDRLRPQTPRRSRPPPSLIHVRFRMQIGESGRPEADCFEGVLHPPREIEVLKMPEIWLESETAVLIKNLGFVP